MLGAAWAGSTETKSESIISDSVIKVAVLVAMCLQNAIYALLRRYSQGVLLEKASPSSMLLFGEIIKLVISWICIQTSQQSTSAPMGPAMDQVRHLVLHSKEMIVPALVYQAMNLLSYVSLERIDAATFTLFAQTKLLSTALCAVAFLGRSFPMRQWRALLLMVLGTVLISIRCDYGLVAEDAAVDTMRWSVGVGAVLLEITMSGFVSVYFEKVLKNSPLTVWDRNFQLAAFSMFCYGALHFAQTRSLHFFQGWSIVTLMVSILGAIGGLLVAMCIKYMDSVVKSLATSGNTVLTMALGYWLLNDQLNPQKVIGAAMVLLSVFNYNEVVIEK